MADAGAAAVVSLAELQARETLREIMAIGWCRAVDRLDWKAMRAIYADEVLVDYHDPALPGVPEPKLWNADEWVHFCRAMEGFDASSHHLSNFGFAFDGDGATVTSYLYAQHMLDGQSYIVGGEYRHGFRLIAGAWKLCAVRLAIWWTEGDAALFSRAMELSYAGDAPRSRQAVRP